MNKLIVLTFIFFISVNLTGQTYKSSETLYLDTKDREKIFRTISISGDTILIVSKGKQVTDVQKLIIQYETTGKMKRIGRAKIYEAVGYREPVYYDIGIQLRNPVKKIGITEVNIDAKSVKHMIFILE